jgi:hypothetical protein
MGCRPSIPEGFRKFSTLSDLESSVQTGDVVLLSGHGPASSFLRFSSISNLWTHTGVVIATRSGGQKHLWIAESNPPLPHYDAISQKRWKDGPQLVDLRERISNYDGFCVAVVRVFPRGTSLDEERRKKAALEFLRSVSRSTYERDPRKFFNAALRRNEDDPDAFYCTEFAAEALWKMEILKKKPGRQFENYTLDDFYWGLTARDGIEFDSPIFLSLRE